MREERVRLGSAGHVCVGRRPSGAHGILQRVAFRVEGCWRGRNVAVTWNNGELIGDPELVSSLRLLDGSAEIIGLDDDDRPIEASLSSTSAALDTICYWVGDIRKIEGDTGGINPAGYLE